MGRGDGRGRWKGSEGGDGRDGRRPRGGGVMGGEWSERRRT